MHKNSRNLQVTNICNNPTEPYQDKNNFIKLKITTNDDFKKIINSNSFKNNKMINFNQTGSNFTINKKINK
jgi:hypothetical protein